MITENQVLNLIKEQLEEDNVYLVSLNVTTGNRIVVLIDSFDGISVEYCIRISRLIEHSFDREEEDFELEVSSAGIGQAFKVHQQYVKCTGKEVEVLGKDGIKIKGVLDSVDTEGFMIKEEKMVKPEGKKRKELQIIEHRYKFDDVKSVIEIISF